MEKYRARVCEQHFLNLPGFHGGAYVRAYVEDTSDRNLAPCSYNQERLENPHPRIVLELSDCSDRIALEFELDSPHRRQNSFHKIDTLIDALEQFRQGLVEESTLYKRRERELKEHEAAGEQQKLRRVS